MLSHLDIWSAIDALAQRHDLSTSGLAKASGLDSTSFNKSKRIAPDGKPRWPSTESIAKILNATGSTIDEFISLISSSKTRPIRHIPLIGFDDAVSGVIFDSRGLPTGDAWLEVDFPTVEEERTYALEVTGSSFLPFFRDGDMIIISPNSAMRRGDRVVVKMTDGEIIAKELKRRTNKTVELCAASADDFERNISVEEIEWISRIVWATQ
jgi:phage repressor protein C with HTH and peptisase S24 domain